MKREKSYCFAALILFTLHSSLISRQLNRNMTTPEIEELKRLIEERYGKQLCTTTDFEEFTLTLKKCGIAVSASTMKRLYDYVGDSHKPRVATLDQLAAYIGHKSFSHFVQWLKNSTRYNS